MSGCLDGANASKKFAITLGSLKCLALRHYTAVVGTEPKTSRSNVVWFGILLCHYGQLAYLDVFWGFLSISAVLFFVDDSQRATLLGKS